MIVRRGFLFVISAPSGTGKSTLIKAVMARLGGIEFSVSHTTRAPRRGEEDGVHYHFVSRERFKEMAAAGEFLEWAEVYGNLYGTSRAALESKRSRGNDVILDIDVQGAAQVARNQPDAIRVFILPPTPDDLERRLRTRNKDTDEVIARRLEEAKTELAQSDSYDYLIVNDLFEEARINLESVIRAQRVKNPHPRDCG